jgi:hypothetical protein
MEQAAAATAAVSACGERRSYWELLAGWCVDGRSQGASKLIWGRWGGR